MPASAQGLSEKAVKTFMNYAWSLTPQKFTKPDGTSVLIDKTKKDEVVVPVQKAREVIMAGRLTAHAQICDLPEAQVANYQSLMRRTQQVEKWTPQQIIYINQLHLTTVMLLTGKIQLVEKRGDKEIVIDDKKESKARTCSKDERTRVKKLIIEYLNSEPKVKSASSKKQG
ncbi:MAG: hypothetical protein AAF732_21910 [Pseudomonadota bacterium]